jgi:hypothetical protein
MKEEYGILLSSPAVDGIQEAVVTKVGTAALSIAGTPAASYPVIWFNFPNTYGDGPGFGPAAYQPVHGWTPSVGDPCIVACVGNGVGRPYVLAFPTATPT